MPLSLVDQVRVCSIYALSDPRTGEVRYVGKTMQLPAERLRVHLVQARRGTRRHVCSWIANLLKEGLAPALQVLETVTGDGCDRERYWIAHGIEQGWKLTNHTAGGDGPLGLKHNDATRAKMSISQTRVSLASGESQRRSERTKNTWCDPEIRKARTEGIRRTVQSGQFSASNRKAQLERWSRPGERERMSAIMREWRKQKALVDAA